MPGFLHPANLKWIVIGVAAGILYGVLVRVSFNRPALEAEQKLKISAGD